MKRLKNWFKVWAGRFIVPSILKLLCMSIRWKRNDLLDRNVLPLDKPSIGAFWHGRQLMMGPLFHSARLPCRVSMLISAHSDGRMIAAAVKSFGVESVMGSSSRGGTRALKELVKVIKDGGWVGITPDGPRGPAEQSKVGVVALSELTGASIYPVSVGFSSAIRFKSWDRMMLPFPFSRGVCLVGEPLNVPRGCSNDEKKLLRQELDHRLVKLGEIADAIA